MALELQRGRSKWWYGRVEVNGRKIGKNLGVEVRGIIPNSLAETGDIAFERSRAKAQAALEKLQLDLKRRSTAEELVQTLHELRTGARVGSIPLDEIAARWSALPRRRPLSQSYLKQAESWISRFVLFLKKTNGSLREMSQVQSSICRAFFKAEEERGVTAKTYNNTLIFLRAVFHALRKDAGLAEDPFEGIPTKDGETVFRKPFTHEDLALIEEKARSLFDFVEQELRFRYVQYGRAYIDILNLVLEEEKLGSRAKEIYDFPLALELGVSSAAGQVFIEIGLSRIAASTFEQLIPDSSPTPESAKRWLSGLAGTEFNLSSVIWDELRRKGLLKVANQTA
ncbi:MAG: hypothetical protein QM790_19225 [Nibricoccus sp.]